MKEDVRYFLRGATVTSELLTGIAMLYVMFGAPERLLMTLCLFVAIATYTWRTR